MESERVLYVRSAKQGEVNRVFGEMEVGWESSGRRWLRRLDASAAPVKLSNSLLETRMRLIKVSEAESFHVTVAESAECVAIFVAGSLGLVVSGWVASGRSIKRGRGCGRVNCCGVVFGVYCALWRISSLAWTRLCPSPSRLLLAFANTMPDTAHGSAAGFWGQAARRRCNGRCCFIWAWGGSGKDRAASNA